MKMSARSTENMTEGNSLKQITLFWLPLLFGNLFQQFYSLVDSIVVGKGIGDAALAAVGSTGILHFLIIGFASGLTRGFCIAFAQSFGRGDHAALRKEVRHSVIISLALSVIMTTLTLLLLRPLMVVMGTPADILPDSLAYFRIILWGIIITIFNNLFMGLLQSLGNSRTPLIAMTISSISNIVMDLLFVMVFHWGVRGASAATILAQLFSLLICGMELRKIDLLKGPGDDKTFDPAQCVSLIKIGIPVALMNSITAVGGVLLQYYVNRLGTAYIAAYSVVMKYAGLFESFSRAVGLTMLTFVGQNYGARRFDRIRIGVVQAMLLTVAVNLPIAIVKIFFAAPLASIMVSSPEVIAHCTEFLPVMGVCLIPLGFLFIFRFSCEGMGNTFHPMMSGVLEVAFRLVFGFILQATFFGIAVAECSAWIGALVMNGIAYWYTIRKAEKKTA